MKVSDIFRLYSGSKLDFNKQLIDDNGVNFVSRNSNNNGVVGKIQLDKGMKVYNKGDISVTLGGTYLLSCFVQDDNFVTAQNVAVLKAKNQMSDIEKWFYCYAIRLNRFKFTAFGREVNKYLKDIEIPSKIPDWVYKTRLTLEKQKVRNIPINIMLDQWKTFSLEDIFEIENCKCSNASNLLEDGNDIEYIGAKKKNNGVMGMVKKNDRFITQGNCIIFICDGQGSVGYTNYIDHDFIGSTTLSVGRSQFLNKYTGIFLVTVLDLERYRYSFGRKYQDNKIKNTKIKLPATKEGYPDWEFMEKYIKSLTYSDIL